MLAGALKGIRVLDLSQYLPGPYATRLLADLGAEVVKVEPPAGDPMRSFLFRDSDGVSPLYKQINAGKTIVFIDLKQDEQRHHFSGLLAKADVLLESYRPGVLGRLGFDRERLSALNPQLIHCAISGFGQDGPASQRAGHDLTYLALSGMLQHTGSGETPVIPFPPVSDYAAGQQAASLILAALLRRQRDGEGCFIDTSLFESILSWQSFGQAGNMHSGCELKPGQGVITGGLACYQIYGTADQKYVVLGALEEKFWQSFCVAVKRPDWISRQYEPMPQEGLIGELRDMFAGAPRQDWVERLAESDCCFEPLLGPDEITGLPQVQARRLLQPALRDELPIDIRFPAVCDGHYPEPRRPFGETKISDLLIRWQAKG